MSLHDRPAVVLSGLGNFGEVCAGQTCILVPGSKHDEFLAALTHAAGELRVGNPSDPRADIGPLVMERQRERVEEYIRIGRGEGTPVALAGGRPAGFDTAWFVEPTIVADVDNSMRIAREEIFGSVLVVIPAADDDEAIRTANDSECGLVGSVSRKTSTAVGRSRRGSDGSPISI